MENIENEMQSLRDIVNTTFNVNIAKDKRERQIVDARFIYSKILRDSGYTLKSIGHSIGRDHTTVIHYIRQVEHFLKYDIPLAEKYIHCKELFLKDRPYLRERIKESDILPRLIKLSEENDKLIAERKAIFELRDKYKRLEPIIEMIDKRTKKGAELLMRKRLEQILNDMFGEE